MVQYRRDLDTHRRFTLLQEVFRKFITSTSVSESCPPLGILNQIPDNRITASSHYLSYYAHYGRLHGTQGGGGWCPKTSSSRNDYLQVDLGAQHALCAVATQGKKSGSFSVGYKLSLSLDGVNWSFYQEQDTNKVLKAVCCVECDILCREAG